MRRNDEGCGRRFIRKISDDKSQVGEKMRINKYIAAAGIASRRKADELIENGNVKVNNMTLTEPGYDVKPGDVVEVNGRRIEAEEKKVYIMLNKPLGYITSVKDDRMRPTVM